MNELSRDIISTLPEAPVDAHTHQERRNAIVDIDPVEVVTEGSCFSSRGKNSLTMPLLKKGYRYSVGIHPLNLYRISPLALRLLRSLAAEPEVVAIGECGYDVNLKSENKEKGDLATSVSRKSIIRIQTDLLLTHVELSESLAKPLILHIVKAFPEIISLKKRLRPRQMWIIHGFRGKPQLASELLAHGFTLSFGQRYNQASLSLTPPHRLLRESDSE